MPKKVTNEKLAQMMQNQFFKLDKKIDGVNENLGYKIDHLKMKVDDIDHKLDDSLAKLDDQDIQLKDHEKRIVVLENKENKEEVLT